MSLFARLIDKVADEENHTLASCLMQAKVLAFKLRSRNLQHWLDAEIEGYNDLKEVPPYRVLRLPVHGDFDGPYGSGVRNVRLDTQHIPEPMKDVVENFRFTEGVAGLEGHLNWPEEVMQLPWDMDVLSVLRAVSGVRVRGMSLNAVYSLMNKATVRGLLHTIRKRLLDFLLELGRKNPDLEKDDEATGKVPPESVTQVLNGTIYQGCNFTGVSSMSHQEFKARDVRVSGNLVVAETIQSSFNQVNESEAGPDVKGFLRELADAVQAMAKELPEPQAKEAAEEYGRLAEAAAKPGKTHWLRAGLEGLWGVAKAAGQFGVNVLTILEKGKTLLGL